jgi:hypothetical protein
MTSAGESCIRERIWMARLEYSVLKEKINDDECGWSHAAYYSYYA